jgi:hypothetical protein
LDDVDDVDDKIQCFYNDPLLKQSNRLAIWDEAIGGIVEAAAQAMNQNEDLREIAL